MRRLTLTATILFGLFIAWIVYLADTGQNCIFFEWVKSVPLGDKTGHFFLFGCLALGANFAFRSRGFRIGWLLLPFGALLVFALAGGEELSQYFFATRTCDITDLLAEKPWQGGQPASTSSSPDLRSKSRMSCLASIRRMSE